MRQSEEAHAADSAESMGGLVAHLWLQDSVQDRYQQAEFNYLAGRVRPATSCYLRVMLAGWIVKLCGLGASKQRLKIISNRYSSHSRNNHKSNIGS